MKTLILILNCLLLFLGSNAQGDDTKAADISIQARAGYRNNPNELIIAAAVNFKAYGFALSPELIASTSDASAANFGLKMSYRYKWVEAGYGWYFNLYSTDAYDKGRNGSGSLYFVSVFVRKWFLSCDYNQYVNSVSFSIGYRETIGRLQ